MQSMISNPKVVNKMGSVSRQLLEKEYSEEVHMRRLESILFELSGKSSSVVKTKFGLK